MMKGRRCSKKCQEKDTCSFSSLHFLRHCVRELRVAEYNPRIDTVLYAPVAEEI